MGLLGQKVRMARMVDSSGAVIATTLLSVGPCYVTQVRTHERDGYAAAQIGYGESKKLNRPELGHLRGIGRLRYLREVRIAPDTTVEVGHKFDVSIFEPYERIDVVAASKGKGFAGVVRRYGFAGGPKTHGQSDRWRAPGSSGAGTTPGRSFKGTLMGGRMGGGRVTVKNLQVVAVDPERCLMAVRGAVPGPRGGLVLVRKRGEPRKAIEQDEQKEE